MVYSKGNYQIDKNSLAFEDYIIQFLKDNLNVTIKVYSFTSTALLNIVSLYRIQVSYMHDDKFFKLNKSFYNFYEKASDIPHFNLDSEKFT